MGVAMLLLATAAGLYVLRSTYADSVYPSIAVADVPVGGESYAAAQTMLDNRATQIVGQTALFTYGDKRWTPALSELGVGVDTVGSLNQAYGIGREESARVRIGSALRLAHASETLPMRIALDDRTLNAWFDRVDGEIGEVPNDASLVISNGEASIKADKNGTIIDRAVARQAILGALPSLKPYAGPLPVVAKVPLVHAADLAPALASVRQALSKPVPIAFGDRTWSLASTDLGGFIVQRVDPAKTGADAVAVEVDTAKLSSWLAAKMNADVNRDPVDAQVAWSGSGLTSVVDSADGYQLRPTKFAEAVAVSLMGDHATVKVPVSVLKPKVDSANLKALGVTTKLSVGDSSFEGSDDARATNVMVGARLLNGTLIAPHGTFSFNHSIGEITADKGYVEAGVVAGERISRDIGGGICQVSTTVFRAAFRAGLPITEWNPHRYRLGFYELDGWTPGLDASILQPDGNPFGGGDFQFENPSDSWMLVESYTDGPRIYVIIYGADLGYTVTVSDPIIGDQSYPPTSNLEFVDPDLPPGTIKTTEYKLAGIDVAYERTVTGKDGAVIEDRSFGTHFFPRGDVYKVSTDMQGLSPASQGG